MEGNIIIDNIKIIKQNNKIELSNINIDKYSNNTTLIKFKKRFNNNKTTKTIIIDNDNKREVILIGEKNIHITYSNNITFDNIYLPEIINTYLKENNKITKETKNNYYYNLNNNLYLINFKETLLNGTKNYIYEINNKNNYKIELNKNYEKEEPTYDITNYSKAYSYGYINILLVSFIISIITIILCIIKS